jgi:hypothetical protein
MRRGPLIMQSPGCPLCWSTSRLLSFSSAWWLGQLWLLARFGCWPAAMMSGQLGAMGLMSLFVAVYMGRMMHQDGSAGLGGGKEDVGVASGDKAAEVGK